MFTFDLETVYVSTVRGGRVLDPEFVHISKWLLAQPRVNQPPLSREEVQGPEYRSTLSVFRHAEIFELAIASGDARPELLESAR